jgi:putative transposase
MSRNLKFAVNEHYHVYNRSVEKRIIFNNAFDYQRLLLLLVLVNDTHSVEVQQLVRDFTIPELLAQTRKPLVKILAFSLMPNHYHLLLKEVTEGGISKFMHKVGTGYTLYFNGLNERSGSLFQGTYKAKHLADDRYLKYLFEYIHLNPVRSALDAGQLVTTDLVKSIIENPYTSLRVYAGHEKGRIAESVVNQEEFNNLFVNVEEHLRRLEQWQEEKDAMNI